MTGVVSLKRMWQRSAVRRRILRTRLHPSRCHRCAWLGFYERPGGATGPVGDLLELPVGARSQLEGQLTNARRAGRISHEYDFRRQNDLGSADWLTGGVRCYLGEARGARSMWAVRGTQATGKFLDLWGDSGAVVNEPDPDYPGPLGNVIAVVQTFVWPLVRPHNCPHFTRHHPGLAPREVSAWKERRSAHRWKALGVVVGAVATIAAVAQLLL